MASCAKCLTLCGLALSLGMLGGCGQEPMPTSPTVTLESVPPAPSPTPLPLAQSPSVPPSTSPEQVSAPLPEREVVKVWDFTQLDKSKWDWQFPGGTPQQSPNGAFYVTKQKGPGPVLRDAGIDATSVKYVRAYLSVQKRTAEGLQPANLDRLPLWWATQADVTGDSKWPFRDEQAISLARVNVGPPSVFIGKIEGNPSWKGTIDSIAIGVPVPDEGLGDNEQFKIEVAKIELLQ